MEGGGDMQIRSAACPKCGSVDVDLDASDLERDKLVCWDCGTVYGGMQNTIPVEES